jgi:hypothetical protein
MNVRWHVVCPSLRSEPDAGTSTAGAFGRPQAQVPQVRRYPVAPQPAATTNGAPLERAVAREESGRTTAGRAANLEPRRAVGGPRRQPPEAFFGTAAAVDASVFSAGFTTLTFGCAGAGVIWGCG